MNSSTERSSQRNYKLFEVSKVKPFLFESSFFVNRRFLRKIHAKENLKFRLFKNFIILALFSRVQLVSFPSCTETLFREIERERSARYSLQEKLKGRLCRWWHRTKNHIFSLNLMCTHQSQNNFTLLKQRRRARCRTFPPRCWRCDSARSAASQRRSPRHDERADAAPKIITRLILQICCDFP